VHRLLHTILDRLHRSAGAEIVDAFQQDEPVNSGLGENIAIEPGERARSPAIAEKTVAAYSQI